MTEKSPVFIKIDEYRKVLDTVDSLKKQIVTIRKTIDDINKLRDEEQEELTQWTERVDDIEQKILFVDNVLFEPEQ
jgi:uncharacterized coiled-coil DUF342 family protein